jgi:hypothetical protein
MLRPTVLAVPVLLLAVATGARAQDVPTTQPGLLQIIIEDIKVGRTADHLLVEAGWPKAFEKSKSPTAYLALASLTGAPQVWFVTPYASYAEEAKDIRRNDADAVLAAERERLSKADAEFLDGTRTMYAVARPDLSNGAFPDIGRARHWEITTFRVKPGHSMQFEAAAKAYIAAAERVAPGEMSFRTYEVVAGMAGPTFLVFASINDYADYDKVMANSGRVWQSMTPAESAIFEKYGKEAELSTMNNRFALDPKMSYVSAETRAVDPAFWNRNP